MVEADADAVRDAVLELGMEDWIPLPEAVATPEIRAATQGDRPTWLVLSAALRGLLAEREIRLYRGRWDDENPRELVDAEARAVLGEECWYAFHPDDPDEERISFVNVRNIRDA